MFFNKNFLIKIVFISGTCLAYAGKATIQLENYAGVKYLGQGKIQNNHTSLLFKIGLTYQILRFMALAAAFRTISYYDTHTTGFEYVDTGEDVMAPEAHGLGNLFFAGLRFSF